jgi:predicted ThiF/HesA family dinucleotide-utilizing enzyme
MFEMLERKGFSSRWLKILRSLLNKGSVGVRINDENSDFFLTGKGVRQGDPISPILFNFMADVFTRMLLKATTHGHISGLMQSMTHTGVISM